MSMVFALEIAILAIIKAHNPLTLGLEINGACAGSGSKNETGSQNQRGDLFHGYTFLFAYPLARGFISEPDCFSLGR